MSLLYLRWKQLLLKVAQPEHAPLKGTHGARRREWEQIRARKLCPFKGACSGWVETSVVFTRS